VQLGRPSTARILSNICISPWRCYYCNRVVRSPFGVLFFDFHHCTRGFSELSRRLKVSPRLRVFGGDIIERVKVNCSQWRIEWSLLTIVDALVRSLIISYETATVTMLCLKEIVMAIDSSLQLLDIIERVRRSIAYFKRSNGLR